MGCADTPVRRVYRRTPAVARPGTTTIEPVSTRARHPMRHRTLLLVALATGVAPLFAQTAPSEQQVIQTLLAEVRELRQDLRNTAATVQRIQIVMYRLGAQASETDKASQRLEQARNECKQLQQWRESQRGRMSLQQAVFKNAQDSAVQKKAEDQAEALRQELEASDREIQRCQADQVDAENQLRTEQAKMSELQDRLDGLDRILESSSANATR